MIKGRRDMQKVMMEKKVAKKKELDIKSVDESEKYFTDDWEQSINLLTFKLILFIQKGEFIWRKS